MNSPILVMNSAVSPNFVGVMKADGSYTYVVEEGNSRFSREGLMLIDDALKKSAVSLSDISHFAFVAGPGSFTGIRTGLAFIKGLAFAGNAKAISLSSLEVLAATAADSIYDTVVPIIDAKLNALYVASFDNKIGRKSEDSVIEPSLLSTLVSGKSVLAGHDSEAFRSFAPDAATFIPSADDVIRVVFHLVAEKRVHAESFIPMAELVPVYLRASYAELNVSRIS
ncbi:MAG: tRNA (adenosine(37)-N6)-threonylcarbamoyltransferase complex dimerization subunit type 1 TsaB [Fibrobacteres bacterium]|nr:tRNA (adenosine(37)-N6)-threonylcarbamoyltransferase complex dimerization subunit type 1 TsaB [Fibrobacterota bacterium]